MIKPLLKKEVRNKKGLVKGNPFWVSFLVIYSCSLAEVCCYIVVSIILRYLINTMGSIWSGGYLSIKWQRCCWKNSASVADPGEGPTLPSPLIFRPNWGSKGRKKKLWHRNPPPPSLPHLKVVWIRHWTYTTKLKRYQKLAVFGAVKSTNVYAYFQVHSMFTGNYHTSRTVDEGAWMGIYTLTDCLLYRSSSSDEIVHLSM